jgi:predicted xylose isomerase-like sugar epimerase
MIMGRGWFSSLTSSHVSRKNGLRQHQWKQEMMKKVAGPHHCSLVYDELHHKTICGNTS